MPGLPKFARKKLRMEVPRLISRQSVLIVDRSAETREVLRTALALRGTDLWEATRADEGLELARRHHPDVIVMDLEIAATASAAVRDGFSASENEATPIVLLGTARCALQSFPTGQFMAKPYHYGPLVRKIERLLDEAQRPRSKDAA
jgi:CheY-like chemotaxis protein